MLILFYMKDSFMPLYGIQCYIIEMSSTVSHLDTDPNDIIFDNSVAKVWLNVSNSLGYIVFKSTILHLRFQDIPDEKN